MKKEITKLPHLKSRLIKYGAAACAVAGVSHNVTSQVVYTDIPDYSGNVGDTVLLDINDDQLADLLIGADVLTTSFNQADILLCRGLFENAFIGSQVGLYSYPFAMEQGSVIECNAEFLNSSAFNTMAWFQTGTLGNIEAGNFAGTTDAFLGFRLKVDGEFHFGWMRLDVGNIPTQFTIKDWAYESTPNWPIAAGSQTSLVISDVSALTLGDVGGNNDASDIEVSFDMASPEVFEEYSVIVVKESAAANFTAAVAEEAISEGNYHSVTPEGNSQVFTLPASLKDADGDDIVERVPYRVFVYGNSSCIGLVAGANGSITLDWPSGLPSASSAGFTAYAADGAIQVLNPSGAADHTVLLTNAAGQLVHQGALGAGQNTFGNGLPAGLYLVKIKNDAGVEYLSKVVVN